MGDYKEVMKLRDDAKAIVSALAKLALADTFAQQCDITRQLRKQIYALGDEVCSRVGMTWKGE